MKKSRDEEREALTVLLDAIGGEPLVGSRFEKEDPDENFSIAEGGEQE